MQRGLQTVGQGPRQLQSVLQRLSQQIEEQRMRLLLEQQRDAPVDVQVGFQLYEDAPQELRSRLWMALLEHPELVARHRALQQMTHAEEPQVVVEGRHEEASVIAPVQAEIKKNEEEYSGREASAGSESFSTPDSAAPSSALAKSETEVASGQDWELVADRGAQRWRQGARLLSGGSFHRAEPWTVEREKFRQDLMAAIAAIPWPLPTDYPLECRYATLLQISIGQEEVDEVIARDIHRTFPEYAQFGLEQGQKALFRVLKAYSLHDLETGYCQGLGFVGGLLLFFVPEEPAFQILCRLLAEQGPNLRRLYLPGLRGLKVALKTFDILLEQHLPNLKAHLDAHGAAPVLFASQWFLTAFSCPFPVGFACRLIDVMLAEDSDAVLMRVALAVMAECEPELLMQDDFEELLMYLKVEPVRWNTHRLRRVLNAAINGSPITLDEIHEATEAAEADEHPIVPLVIAPAAARGVEGDDASQGLQVDFTHESGSGEVDNTSAPLETAVVGQDKGEASTRDNLAQELAAHQAELDTAYVQMVLDLDHLWTGGDDESGGGVMATYEEALKAGTKEEEPGSS